jgi:hypothetical protein
LCGILQEAIDGRRRLIHVKIQDHSGGVARLKTGEEWCSKLLEDASEELSCPNSFCEFKMLPK